MQASLALLHSYHARCNTEIQMSMEEKRREEKRKRGRGKARKKEREMEGKRIIPSEGNVNEGQVPF